MPPTRPIPAVGDRVSVQFLGSQEPGRLTAVDGPRVLVETATASEWFALSPITGRFVRAGEAYFPRLIWQK